MVEMGKWAAQMCCRWQGSLASSAESTRSKALVVAAEEQLVVWYTAPSSAESIQADGVLAYAGMDAAT